MRRKDALSGSFLVLAVVLVGASACAAREELPASAGFGPNPTLPDPDSSLVPTINVASATGWPSGATPVAATGTSVVAYAQGLDHPRWLYVLPNGDVLVAETSAPERPEEGK